MYISGAACPHSLLLPFPEHGRGREGREGEREPVHPADASGSHLFREGSAAGMATLGGECPECTGTRESGSRGNRSQQPGFLPAPTLPRCRTLAKSHIHLCIYSSCSGWSPLYSSSSLLAVLSAHLWVPWATKSHHLSCCGLAISGCWSQD